MLKSKLEGFRLSIVDDAVVEDLGFSGDSVVATIGAIGGAVCAPVLSFEVTGSDSLVIDRENFNIQWSQVEINDESISVVRNGIPTIYKIVARPSSTNEKRKLP